MAYDIGTIRHLTSEHVREVIRDIQILQRGGAIHYCTDPHEIYDFCFPVKPEHLRRTDIPTLADEQIALYEAFFEWPRRPLLLPAYTLEMARLAAYLESVVDRTYAQKALFDYVEAPLSLLKSVGRSDRTGDVLPVVEDAMNSVMVIALGLISMGVARFDDIAGRRLQFLDDMPDIAPAANDYVPSELVGEICDAMQEAKFQSPTLAADAEAVDCLIFLNASAEEAYLSGSAQGRTVFLYLSSAFRSKLIVELPSVKQVLPVVDGARLSFLRTRAQMFLMVLTRRYDDRGMLDYTETLKALERIHAVVRELESIKPTERCGTCLVDGGVGLNCTHRDRCGGLREVAARVRERRSVLNNLALARIVDRYGALKRVSEASANERRAIYGAFLTRVRDSETQRVALQRIKDIYRIVRHKCHFAVRVARGFATSGRYAFLRSGRDAVSAASQYLPLMPNVDSRAYEELTEAIVGFYRHPTQTSAADLGGIETISEEFLRMDAALKEFDAAHELIRCLLYMALPVHDGDEAALRHAEDMIKRFADRPQEFLYIAAWAGRRSRKYDDADKRIREAVTRYPHDPRFWHGDALNVYAWLVDPDVSESCPYSVADAISSTQRAIDLLSAREARRWREALAANYNNLAFFAVFRPGENGYDVQMARHAIDAVKRIVPKVDWDPTFPEYYHTEALVELHEALTRRAEGHPLGEVRVKLVAAQREISNALRMVPDKDTYQQLRDTIVKELKATT